jgi:hypothetical protein
LILFSVRYKIYTFIHKENAMKNQFKVILAFWLLAAATLACALPANLPIPSLPGANGPLLQNDFEGSDQTWGTGTDADSSTEYADGGLQFKVYKSKFFVWSSPNDTEYSQVHIEVTAKNNSTDGNDAFGIMCDQGIPDSNVYYFALTASGKYAIAKGAVAKEDLFLTNADKWAPSDQITQNAASYRLGADCGNGTLTFYVDGKQIASVQDTSYEKGHVALFVWTDKEDNGADVTFDDFVVTSLK